MRLEPAVVKQKLSEQIAAISQPEFAHQYVYELLPEYCSLVKPTLIDDIYLCTVQNDGTGAATIEYTVRASTKLFAKLYMDDSGAHAFSVLRKLWEDRFGSLYPYQVPEPLCFLPEHNLLLMREARGECLASCLNQDMSRASEGMKRAAKWLLDLHSSSVRVGEPDKPWYVFLKLADRLSKAVASHPEELRRLLAMLDQLRELETCRSERTLVQIHGQFRPIHVFLDNEVVTVIDLDRSHPADPAIDLAEFVHRLRSTIYRADGAIDQANYLTKTFLEEYAEQSPYRLDGLAFFWGYHVLVSLCRHVKHLCADDPQWERTINFYLSEFEVAMSNNRFPRARAL